LNNVGFSKHGGYQQSIQSKHSTITTKEINKIYTITMQSIKFNTSREVMLLLLVAPIWLTTPAHAHNKPGSQFDPNNTLSKPIGMQIVQSDRTVKMRQQRCQTAALTQLQVVQKKLALERSRFQETNPVIQDLREQEKAKLAAVEKCAKQPRKMMMRMNLEQRWL
jgi:hypothetical protein